MGQSPRFAPRESKEWKDAVKKASASLTGKNKGRPICADAGGYRRSDGLPCRSPFPQKNGLCKRHGGKVPLGMEVKHFKHGRISRVFKHLPTRFHDAFEASADDEDLLSMRTDISISDARIEELLGRLDTGESKERWKAVSDLRLQMSAELRESPPALDVLAKIAGDLRELETQNSRDEEQWRAIRDQTTFRSKLADAERARLKDIHAFITAEDALVVVMRLVDVIVRHVEDASALNAIMQEVEVLTKDQTS